MSGARSKRPALTCSKSRFRVPPAPTLGQSASTLRMQASWRCNSCAAHAKKSTVGGESGVRTAVLSVPLGRCLPPYPDKRGGATRGGSHKLAAGVVHRGGTAVSEEQTTVVVQRYLDDLARDTPAEPVVRALLDRAVRRLHHLCAALLHRSYSRLTRPPLNLQTDELLGAVVERLLKALRNARPTDVRQFFAMACQHMRWELNDLARRLDERPPVPHVEDGLASAPADSNSALTPAGLRMIAAIDALPDAEREAFDLVRIQGMTNSEAATVLGVSTRTVQRRLNCGLQLLADALGDLAPQGDDPGPT